jgi:hypothetical protein
MASSRLRSISGGRVENGRAAPTLGERRSSEHGTAEIHGKETESKELLAGYRIVDVESRERAIELAAGASAAPGPGGKPIKQPIEVREVMGAPMPEE